MSKGLTVRDVADIDTVSFPFCATLEHSGNPQYRLIKPVRVWIDRGDLGFLVYDEQGFTYGTGDSIAEALDDYRDSLVAEFETLRKDRAILSEALQRESQKLERYIETTRRYDDRLDEIGKYGKTRREHG